MFGWFSSVRRTYVHSLRWIGGNKGSTGYFLYEYIYHACNIVVWYRDVGPIFEIACRRRRRCLCTVHVCVFWMVDTTAGLTATGVCAPLCVIKISMWDLELETCTTDWHRQSHASHRKTWCVVVCRTIATSSIILPNTHTDTTRRFIHIYM